MTTTWAPVYPEMSTEERALTVESLRRLASTGRSKEQFAVHLGDRTSAGEWRRRARMADALADRLAAAEADDVRDHRETLPGADAATYPAEEA